LAGKAYPLIHYTYSEQECLTVYVMNEKKKKKERLKPHFILTGGGKRTPRGRARPMKHCQTGSREVLQIFPKKRRKKKRLPRCGPEGPEGKKTVPHAVSRVRQTRKEGLTFREKKRERKRHIDF